MPCTEVKIKNTTEDMWVPSKAGDFLTSWAIVRFSTRPRLHGVKNTIYRNVTSCSSIDVSRNFADHIPNAQQLFPFLDLYISRIGKEAHGWTNSTPPSGYHTYPTPSFLILPSPAIKSFSSYGFSLVTALWASCFRSRGDGKGI